jgi:hypothetical protein
MASERRSDAELVRAIDLGLAEDVLSDDYPLEEVERELREAGLDPDQVAKRGSAAIQQLAKKRRLAWQAEAGRLRDAMQAKLAARPRVSDLPKAELLARIEAARGDRRLSGPVLLAARNLSSSASDDELSQIVEEIEALALLADEGGPSGDHET